MRTSDAKTQNTHESDHRIVLRQRRHVDRFLLVVVGEDLDSVGLLNTHDRKYKSAYNLFTQTWKKQRKRKSEVRSHLAERNLMKAYRAQIVLIRRLNSALLCARALKRHRTLTVALGLLL